eukprot:360154-Chlamydomonas_euryale.AAC.1
MRVAATLGYACMRVAATPGCGGAHACMWRRHLGMHACVWRRHLGVGVCMHACGGDTWVWGCACMRVAATPGCGGAHACVWRQRLGVGCACMRVAARPGCGGVHACVWWRHLGVGVCMHTRSSETWVCVYARALAMRLHTVHRSARPCGALNCRLPCLTQHVPCTDPCAHSDHAAAARRHAPCTTHHKQYGPVPPATLAHLPPHCDALGGALPPHGMRFSASQQSALSTIITTCLP